MTSWAGPAFVLQPQGGQAYNSVVVDHSPFLVGRQSDSSLQLAHAAVSGRHAEIVYDGDGWWIVDCGSTNGTFVNGGCVDARARVECRRPRALRDVRLRDRASHAVHHRGRLTGDPDARADQLGRHQGPGRTVQHRPRPAHVSSVSACLCVGQPRDLRWEALGRGVWADGPISSGRLFHLASRNAVEAQLSERFRDSAVQCAVCRHCWPERTAPHLFFNLHPVGRPQSPFALFGADTSALPRTCPFVRLDVVGHYV